MVLKDNTLQNMTLNELLAVTKPKVEGSMYLSDLFLENTLDFFIFFSSVSTVVGNHGQANYAAANSFMASLAEQRREKGLAASVIDIGAISGIGYISRTFEDDALSELVMRTSGFTTTSERDFHQLFGEAVLAGRPGSCGPIELVSGLQRFSPHQEHQPVWRSWPRMSHLIQSQVATVDSTSCGWDKAEVPVKARLAEASDDDIYNIILDSFSHQLGSHFQLDTVGAIETELVAMRLDQLGIDSLIAVEIRGWFVTTLDVNIPVLKILNGSTVGDLVATASEAIRSRRDLMDGQDFETTSQDKINSTSITTDQTDGSGDIVDEGNVTSRPSSVQAQETTRSPVPDIQKSIPVSFTQARFYPSGLFLEDRVCLNHTVWARISGPIDTRRLRRAVHALGQQHAILRTAFFDEDGRQMQHILGTTRLRLEEKQINGQEEVLRIALTIQKTHVYDVARGETMRILLLTRSAEENYLVTGVHPLIMDATGIQVFLRWLALHYTGHPDSQRHVKQFATASEERRADYAAGNFEADLSYWKQEFALHPSPLPLLTVAKRRS